MTDKNPYAHWAEMGKVVFWKFWLLSSVLVVKLAMDGYGKILCSKALFSKLNWLHIVPMLSYDFVSFTTTQYWVKASYDTRHQSNVEWSI